LREKKNKSGITKKRAEGRIPGVLYGTKDNLLFDCDERDVNKMVFTKDEFNVVLDLDGKTYSTVIRELQFDPITDRVTHFDLLLIESGKNIKVSLPINLTGSSKGVLNGGKLAQPMRKVQVEGLLENIPDVITIDITELRIGQSVKIAELEEKNIRFIDPDTNVVVAVRVARGALEDEEEEIAATEESAEAGAEEPESTED
jgi:large subunit ribosomal protein L25